jgi:hypothetical protein
MHVALEPRRTIRRAKRKKVSKKNDTTKSGEVNKEREKMGEKKNGKREATVHYLQSTAIVKDGRSREGTWVVYGGKSVRK